MKKIVLIGNPNVGKSVLFSRLTGVRVIASNYPGTTVEFMEGYLTVDEEQMMVFDLPGTYSLDPSMPAEEVSVKMLPEADAIVNVIDATNLERNLTLTMELLETGRPMVVALNMFDEIKHRGVSIDAAQLEKLLGVEVIPTSGITGLGIKSLKERLRSVSARKEFSRTREERWRSIGHITESVQKLSPRRHTFWEILEDVSVNYVWGMFIAAAVVFAGFKFIRFVGEGLIAFALEPFFQNVYRPLLERVSGVLGRETMLHSLLIGKLFDGKIDFQQSFGLLTTAPYVEFVMVLPYLFSFYLVLSFLEDSGYLPRLALLLDNVMHRLGLHGFAIIPVLLGFGCNVPGILGTRILESKRERFIAATLISVGVPCAALQAMIVGILGKFGGRYVALVYAVLFCVWLFLGALLNRFLKGYSPELLLEIPPYRFPAPELLAKKIAMRVRGFVVEALPIIMISIMVINVFQQFRIFELISAFFSPLLSRVFGLPKEAIWVLIVGLLRKDIAAGMLLSLHLSVKQLIIACLVLSMSFPCVATVAVFLKELGWKRLLQAGGITAAIAVLVGGTMNFILP